MNELRVARKPELQLLRYAKLDRFVLRLYQWCFKNWHPEFSFQIGKV
jgi:hypothetical protein